MSEKTLSQLKQDLFDLMVEVEGRDYTFGWLSSAYIYGNVIDPQVEREMVIKVYKELADKKLMNTLKNQS